MNTNVKIFELGSPRRMKGNQYKWFNEPYYIKADTSGYESLSEVLCSVLISFIKDIDFVKYEFCQIKDIKTGELINGCYCKSYLNGNETSYGIYNYLNKRVDYKMKDKSNEELYEEILNLGISNTYDYLSKTIYIDALILNEDRHFNNIQIIENNDTGGN